jgi:hypothetical protein
MDQPAQPLRCPHCQALVVDRRFPNCTTCGQALPAEWVMSKAQAAKMMKIDAQARALHTQEMRNLDPNSDPNRPAIVKLLESPVYGPPL